jgi:hypothetical protein
MENPMTYAQVLTAPAPACPPPQRSAPPIVQVIAVLQYLGGVAALAVGGLFAYLTVVVANDTNAPDDFVDPRMLAIAFGVLAGFSSVSGALGIFLGRMLQRGRQWARVVVLMLSGLTVVVVAGSVAVHSTHWTIGVFALHPALCVALLNLRTARAWFR